MRIAYVISAYKYPEQLTRLVARLSTDLTMFFVHIDRKTDHATYLRMIDGLSRFPRVHILERYRCDWGGFGHVAATLAGIRAALKSDDGFDYMILLTGQDYPIKSNVQIRGFLETHAGKQFLHHFSLPTDEWEKGGMERIESWHLRLFRRHYRFPGSLRLPIKRTFPAGFQPFGGSSYWCLSHECVAYIHDLVTRNPAFVDFVRFVDVPDELFFQTVVLNSSFRSVTVNDNLHYIDWSDPHAGSPAVLRKTDFPALSRCDKLFARKFDTTIDPDVLDMIDHELLDWPDSGERRVTQPIDRAAQLAAPFQTRSEPAMSTWPEPRETTSVRG